MNQVGKHDAQGKRDNGKQESQRLRKLSERKMDSYQKNVAGLRICKHASATDVGIGVHEAARECQNSTEFD